jgi:hypothetical protein
MTHNADFGPVLTSIQYFDAVRAERSGANKDAQQLSPDVLAKLPSGIAIAQLQNASQALIELIARVFAETGVKRLFRLVHALTLKHARQQEVVRLRNKWVTVDPRQWKTRMDMTISVGLGTGNKEQQMLMLERIMQMQMGLLPLGLATRDTIHHTASKFTQAAGFKDKDAFWPDPKTNPPPPPQPDPKVQAEMAKLQLQAQAAQQDAVLERQKAAQELQFKQVEMAAEIQLERQKAAAEIQLERERAAAQIEIEREKAQAQAVTKHQSEMIKAMKSPREKEVVRGKDGKVAKIIERAM